MKSSYMERAIRLALKARGRTSPNPIVGAVLVKSGKVIGEGFHAKAGKDHAEIVALKKAGKEAKGTTLYVTLEPCCHHGKTPPCVDAIISAGVKKVLVATRDPNPLVSGKGIAKLKKAGITIQEGLLQNEARKINEAWEKFITQKRPFVVMKAAQSLDAKIASPDGESKWISNELARKRVHEMRAECDAVMVGVNTILKDDPRLNVRPASKNVRQPARVVVDTNLKTSPDAQIFHSAGGEVYIATSTGSSPAKAKILEEKGARIIRVPMKEKCLDLNSLMNELGKLDIVSILLEGGSRLFTLALKEGIVDKMALFYAPIIIGGLERYSLVQELPPKKIADSIRITNVTYTDYNDNLLVEGYVRY